MDSIFYAVGELKAGSYVPLAVNLRPTMHLKTADGSFSSERHSKDTPAQILLQGQLDRNPPAVISFHLRAGARFIDTPGSTWRIYGTKAELVMEFTSAGPQIAKATSIRMSNFAENKVEEIVVNESEEWSGLPKQGQNIGRLYEAYATGNPYGDFDLAVKRHQLLDEFWATMDEESNNDAPHQSMN